MKRTVKALLLLGVVAMTGIVSPILIQANGDDDEIIFIKTKGGDENGGGPRSNGTEHILAGYSAATHLVSVLFQTNLGIVNIDIENEDTGELSTYMVNSAVVNHSFIISGDSGYWSITFTLPDGAEYVGEWAVI